MKNGFRETVDIILRKYGLKTRDCVGTVWADGDISWRILNVMGYRVEQGISNPDYDYVIISKGKSTLNNILKALLLTKVGCIIIFRAENVALQDFVNLAKLTGSSVKHEIYTTNSTISGYGILGVLFKGKEI